MNGKHSQAQTTTAGLDHIRRNHAEDNWFLQIECFDPHEPFFSPQRYKDRYPHAYAGPIFDWPGYRPVQETPAQVEHARCEYAALLSMCDAHLGDVLEAMDEYALWRDTMLIVWTDHGFLLGEHGCWAKNWMPLYEEISHTPFFVWDPRCPQTAGQRRQSLVQPAIDLGPTLLEFFGQTPTPDMRGCSLCDTIASDQPVRDAAIFGYHGDRVNVTDGRYVYLRAPAAADNQPLASYTLMPTMMRGFLGPDQLGAAELSEPFSFTKGCRPLRVPQQRGWAARSPDEKQSLLFDLQADPGQEPPLADPAVEQRMIDHLTQLLRDCDAPAEQSDRLGLAR